MRTILAAALLVVACNHNTGPVAGAPEAAARHYPVTVAHAHDALAKVLADHYGKLVSDDGRHLVADAACRTASGNACVGPINEPGDADYQPINANGLRVTQQSPTSSGYWIKVFGGVVGTDGDVQVQLGGMSGQLGHDGFPIGTDGAPAWAPHEVDTLRIEIDRALR